MSGKEHFTTQMNWRTTTPVPYNPTTPVSGVLTGTMSGTNTIYTNIYPVLLMDNNGIEITWTGTPTGTISIMMSVSGLNFYALTFNPVLDQPSGSAGGYLININQEPFNYLMVQYTNSAGSGVLTAWTTCKDVN